MFLNCPSDSNAFFMYRKYPALVFFFVFLMQIPLPKRLRTLSVDQFGAHQRQPPCRCPTKTVGCRATSDSPQHSNHNHHKPRQWSWSPNASTSSASPTNPSPRHPWPQTTSPTSLFQPNPVLFVPRYRRLSVRHNRVAQMVRDPRTPLTGSPQLCCGATRQWSTFTARFTAATVTAVMWSNSPTGTTWAMCRKQWWSSTMSMIWCSIGWTFELQRVHWTFSEFLQRIDLGSFVLFFFSNSSRCFRICFLSFCSSSPRRI